MGKREVTAVLERPINRAMVGRDEPGVATAPPITEPITEPPLDPATAEMVDMQAKIELAVEALFGRLARDEALTANEWLFLKQHCPPNAADNVHAFKRWLDGCTSRIRAVLDLQAAAGSAADRAAAAAAAESARQRQAEQGPPIQEQITKLQAELQALADATAQAERDVQRREQAVTSLQIEHLQPPRIREQIAVIYRANEADKRAFLKAEGRLESIVGLLALRPDVKEQLAQIDAYAHGENVFGGGRLSDTVFLRDPPSYGDVRLPTFQPDAWARHCDVLRAETEQHRATIAYLEPINKRVAEEVRQLRCFLVPK
jgi:hypothetical protein